jgi:hypothetical protein
LEEDFTGSRMYGVKSTPFRVLKLLTPIFFTLEYVRQLVKIDEAHFFNSKEKNYINYPIVMGLILL